MRNLASWASGIRTREYSSQSAVPYHLAIALYLLLGVTSRQGGCLYNHPNVLNGDASQVATHSSTSYHAIVHLIKLSLHPTPKQVRNQMLWILRDSNPRPTAYEAVALTN